MSDKHPIVPPDETARCFPHYWEMYRLGYEYFLGEKITEQQLDQLLATGDLVLQNSNISDRSPSDDFRVKNAWSKAGEKMRNWLLLRMPESKLDILSVWNSLPDPFLKSQMEIRTRS